LIDTKIDINSFNMFANPTFTDKTVNLFDNIHSKSTQTTNAFVDKNVSINNIFNINKGNEPLSFNPVPNLLPQNNNLNDLIKLPKRTFNFDEVKEENQSKKRTFDGNDSSKRENK
ncbi:hypothetical protein H311_05163, partial [Anncaliia algerae PRA109]